jgi:hypothetical protein
LRELLKIQSKVAERKRLVSEFELSLQDKVAIVETTTTARPELMQRAVDSFQKLGHSYLGVFHRATTLLDLMIDRHKSKTDEFERSLKVFYEKYRDATKLSFVGWRSSHVVSRLKELDDNASILREVAEYKSDENDEYMKELRIIIRVLQTRNSADKSQSP